MMALDTGQVLAFLQTHTQEEAANHFGCSVKTIYNHKVRAASVVAVELPRPSSVARASFMPHDDVAGATTSFRCPVSGELVRVAPGTHRLAWEHERKALQLTPVIPVLDLGSLAAVPVSTLPESSGNQAQFTGSSGTSFVLPAPVHRHKVVYPVCYSVNDYRASIPAAVRAMAAAVGAMLAPGLPLALLVVLVLLRVAFH
jgi:hypothetical protein